MEVDLESNGMRRDDILEYIEENYEHYICYFESSLPINWHDSHMLYQYTRYININYIAGIENFKRYNRLVMF